MAHELRRLIGHALTTAHLAEATLDRAMLDQTRSYLLEALERVEQVALRAIRGCDVRYLSACPPGYQTVLGYLATHEPEMLELLDKDPSATADDGVWCGHRCIVLGVEPVQVRACPWLADEHGIARSVAYPIRVLQERFARTSELAYG